MGRRMRMFLWTILATFFGGAAAADAPAVGEPLAAVQLALNWKAEPQFGGFYAAQRINSYAKQGLTVKIMEGGAGTPTVQMVAAGRVEFGIVSGDEVVVARSKGADVVALFAVYQTNPQVILTHAEHNFTSLADVYANEGRLSLQSGLPYAEFLKQKYPKSKVQFVPHIGGIGNFLSDVKLSQQGFITSEPLMLKRQGKSAKTFLIADEGYNPYTTVLVTNGEFLKKHEVLAHRMVAAVRAGWEDYLSTPDPTNQIMAKLNKSMDATIFNESAAAQRPLIENAETRALGLGVMTESRWKTLTQQLLDMKFIDKAPVVSELFRWNSIPKARIDP